MSLVRPGHVGRSDQQDSNAAMSGRLNQLVERPVLQNEADDKHEDAKSPEYGNRGDFAIFSVTDPKPSKEEHREAVDGP